jgi:hypothetical protein
MRKAMKKPAEPAKSTPVMGSIRLPRIARYSKMTAITQACTLVDQMKSPSGLRNGA